MGKRYRKSYAVYHESLRRTMPLLNMDSYSFLARFSAFVARERSCGSKSRASSIMVNVLISCRLKCQRFAFSSVVLFI